MSELNNSMAVYEIEKITAIEDNDGNLIDFDCKVTPINFIAEIVDAGDKDDFENIEKTIIIGEGIKEEIKILKEQYGNKNLIPDDEDDNDEYIN